jgi:hypothetical protein
MKHLYTLLFCLVFTTYTQAQIVLKADGPGNTYTLINNTLAPGTSEGAVENPECPTGHPNFGPHIKEAFDSILNEYVFLFYSHVDSDNDRCINFDRQRIEIKTTANGLTQSYLTGLVNDSAVYKWKFKLDKGFQPSNSFTHIHQIKGTGGSDIDNPIITLTPRAGTPEKMQLLYCPTDPSGQTEKYSTTLAPFKGTWVSVTEKLLYRDNGKYEITINRVSDDSLMFHYAIQNIDLWRTGANWNRPKWGIYRSLNSKQQLRDEIVKFADFSVWDSAIIPPVAIKNNIKVSGVKIIPNPAISYIKIQLSNKINNLEFRIVDQTGRVVMGNLAVTAQNIDISKLSSGVFNLLILKGGNIIERQLFVKQ